MKQNKVLKSLEELSPELLAPEVAQTAETIPELSELVAAESEPLEAFLPPRFLTESDTRGYRGWGINE